MYVKRSNSARCPQCLNLTPPKTKQFCKTGKLSAELMASYQCGLWLFHHLSNALRLPRKSEARSYEVLHLWRKIILANLKIWCSKMIQNATLLRTSAPWPPNTSDEDVCCTAPATRAASLQIFFKRPTPAVVFGSAAKPACLAHFSQGAESMAPATRNCPKFKKWSETVSF